MAEYDNSNRGALWGNKDKTDEKHPDFKGSININGVEYWLSGWKRKEGASAKSPALSLSIKPKDDKPAAKSTGTKAGTVGQIIDDMDGDSIPF